MVLLFAGPGAHAQTTTQYTYDALGRVVSAIDQDGKKVAYSYDAVGNRTRVSNGAEFAELLPTAWTASSNAGTTGLTASNGMRDGLYGPLASIHVTNTEAGAWIKADLGSAKAVNHIELAPTYVASFDVGVKDLNDARVEYSVDGTTWKYVATLSSTTLGATRTVTLGGVTLRYLRLYRPASGRIALGDLKLFSAAASSSSLIANPDSITSAGSLVTFDPRTNDQDLDGYSFAIATVDTPLHGVTANNGGASITYTPNPGYVGADSFGYSVADGHNGLASARVSAMVRASANQNPVGVPDSFSIPSRATSAVDGTVALHVLANDYDPDGDTLSVSAPTTPGHGIVALQGTTVVTYQPNVTHTGPDSFSYTLSDGQGHSIPGVTVNLAVGNSAPIANADTASTNMTTPSGNGTGVFIPVLVNDSDPNGDALTVQAGGPTAHGYAYLYPDQTLFYFPTNGYVGSDAFTYVIADGNGKTASATVSVSVIDPNPQKKYLRVMQPGLYANQVTIADATFTVPTSTSVNVYVDTPITSGKVYWEVKLLCGYLLPGVANSTSTAFQWGGLGNANAGLYTAGWGWAGSTNNISTLLSAGAVNDVFGLALDADAHTLKLFKNNVAGATLSLPFSGPYYPHSGVQIYAIANQACPDNAASGEFHLAENGLTYAPPTGYVAHHRDTQQNRTPRPADDMAYVTPGVARAFDPRTNDTDPDGDTIAIAAVGAPNNGVATLNGGTSITYTPAVGFSGVDSFTYTVSDPSGATAAASVTVVVGATPVFSISPAVAGKTTWNLESDGPLNLATPGVWAITPQSTFTAPLKAWGAGGSYAWAGGGGGGYAGGYVKLTGGVSYNLYVGGPGKLSPVGANGGANGGGAGGVASAGAAGGGGGGYSGVRTAVGVAVVIAGGGGGGGYVGHGGGGGGVTAGSGTGYSGGIGGGGGGGTAYTGGTGGTSGSYGYAGGGGGGYLGGGGGTSSSTGGGGGGGGTGYIDPTLVSTAAQASAVATTPGNSDDPVRGGAGSNDTAGLLALGGGTTTSVPIPNTPPVAVNDTVSVSAPTATFDPRTNDSDANGDTLSLQSVTTPANGTAAINVTGGIGVSVTYTPTVGTSGPDSFSYTVIDGHGGTATATVNLTVAAPNPPAFAWSTAGTIATAVTTVTTSKGANTIAAGDLLLAFETTSDNTGLNHNITCPTGFTALSWSNYYYSAASAENQAGCWKIAGASETGAYTFNWTTGMTQSSQWTLIKITGANTAPIDVTAIQGNFATSSPTPTVTSSGANRLFLSCVGAAGSSIAFSSPPSGMTQLFTSNTGAIIKFSCAGKTAASGATGAQTWTLNQANPSAAFSLLIKP